MITYQLLSLLIIWFFFIVDIFQSQGFWIRSSPVRTGVDQKLLTWKENYLLVVHAYLYIDFRILRLDLNLQLDVHFLLGWLTHKMYHEIKKNPARSFPQLLNKSIQIDEKLLKDHHTGVVNNRFFLFYYIIFFGIKISLSKFKCCNISISPTFLIRQSLKHRKNRLPKEIIHVLVFQVNVDQYSTVHLLSKYL